MKLEITLNNYKYYLEIDMQMNKLDIKLLYSRSGICIIHALENSYWNKCRMKPFRTNNKLQMPVTQTDFSWMNNLGYQRYFHKLRTDFAKYHHTWMQGSRNNKINVS